MCLFQSELRCIDCYNIRFCFILMKASARGEPGNARTRSDGQTHQVGCLNDEISSSNLVHASHTQSHTSALCLHLFIPSQRYSFEGKSITLCARQSTRSPCLHDVQTRQRNTGKTLLKSSAKHMAEFSTQNCIRASVLQSKWTSWHP